MVPGKRWGASGQLMTQHMWGGIVVATATWICWFLRARINLPRFARFYGFTLIAALGLVSFTGYRGGQLSQGADHLTEFMPAPLRSLLGFAVSENGTPDSPRADPSTFMAPGYSRFSPATASLATEEKSTKLACDLTASPRSCAEANMAR